MKLRLTLLLFVILLCNAIAAIAQPDSILKIPADKQLIALWQWYQSMGVKADSQQMARELKRAEEIFTKEGNKVLQQQTWLIQRYFRASKLSSARAAAEAMLDAADAAAEKDWPLIQGECLHYAGNFYFRDEMYPLAFEYMQRAQFIFDKAGAGTQLQTMRHADALANCYYHFGEYRQAVKYLRKIEMVPGGLSSILYMPSVYNTLGLCYQQLKVYDSAAIWYKKSYELAAAAKDTFYMGLANGNLGYSNYLQGQYEKALPLLQQDFEASTRAHEPGSAANAAISISGIFLKKGQPDFARKYLDQARPVVFEMRNVILLKNYYEAIFNLSKATADYKHVGIYADSFVIYRDSVIAWQNKKAFNQSVLKLETEKHLNEVNQLESARRQQILLRNSLLGGLVLLAIIAILWVNRQLLKRQKEKELAQQQLQFAEQELLNYTSQLREKNELLEQLRKELNEETNDQERAHHINNLLTATIVTEEDWKKFRQLFEKVYPGFFLRLREKIPDLTPTETRLLSLTRLQMPTKDMAAMLGVGYDAIKKARQRLRRKIDLPEEGSLQELADMI